MEDEDLFLTHEIRLIRCACVNGIMINSCHCQSDIIYNAVMTYAPYIFTVKYKTILHSTQKQCYKTGLLFKFIKYVQYTSRQNYIFCLLFVEKNCRTLPSVLCTTYYTCIDHKSVGTVGLLVVELPKQRCCNIVKMKWAWGRMVVVLQSCYMTVFLSNYISHNFAVLTDVSIEAMIVEWPYLSFWIDFFLGICPACVPNILPTVIQMLDIYSTLVNNQFLTGIRAPRGQLVDCRQ